MNCERILLLGLRLAVDLMAAPLSAEMLQVVRANEPVNALAAKIRHRLGSADGQVFGLIEHELLYPRMRERWRDRIPYSVYVLRQSARLRAQDKALMPVPAYLSMLYYSLRVIRLISTYGLRPLRARLGGKVV